MISVTALQFLCHLIGDYCLQSDYMAIEKTTSWKAAIAHGLVYTLPFLLVTRSIPALAFIAITHIIIDHYRLARYVGWAKNFLAPKWIQLPVVERVCMMGIGLTTKRIRTFRNFPWSECSTTGYSNTKPVWLSVWLLIITDNTMHLTLNAIAASYL